MSGLIFHIKVFCDKKINFLLFEPRAWVGFYADEVDPVPLSIDLNREKPNVKHSSVLLTPKIANSCQGYQRPTGAG